MYHLFSTPWKVSLNYRYKQQYIVLIQSHYVQGKLIDNKIEKVQKKENRKIKEQEEK